MMNSILSISLRIYDPRRIIIMSVKVTKVAALTAEGTITP
jgi:hypothetical protein